MADSDTTQQVNYCEACEKLSAEVNALITNIQQSRAERREAREKLSAEFNALITNSRLRRAEREAEDREKSLAEATNSQQSRAEREKLLAEVNALVTNSRQRRAEREKLLAEANSQLKQAEPFLTTSQWLSAIFIAASLAGF